MKKKTNRFVCFSRERHLRDDMIWIIKNTLKIDWFISYRIVPNDERYKKYQFCLKNFFRYVGFRRTTTWGRPQLKIDQFVSYHTLLIIQMISSSITVLRLWFIYQHFIDMIHFWMFNHPLELSLARLILSLFPLSNRMFSNIPRVYKTLNVPKYIQTWFDRLLVNIIFSALIFESIMASESV